MILPWVFRRVGWFVCSSLDDLSKLGNLSNRPDVVYLPNSDLLDFAG